MIPKEILGFSVGFVNSSQNLAMTLSPIAIGYILDSSISLSSGYKGVSLMMGLITTLAFSILAIWAFKFPNKAISHE